MCERWESVLIDTEKWLMAPPTLDSQGSSSVTPQPSVNMLMLTPPTLHARTHGPKHKNPSCGDRRISSLLLYWSHLPHRSSACLRIQEETRTFFFFYFTIYFIFFFPPSAGCRAELSYPCLLWNIRYKLWLPGKASAEQICLSALMYSGPAGLLFFFSSGVQKTPRKTDTQHTHTIVCVSFAFLFAASNSVYHFSTPLSPPPPLPHTHTGDKWLGASKAERPL